MLPLVVDRDDGPDADQQDQAHQRRQHGGPEIARFRPLQSMPGAGYGLDSSFFKIFSMLPSVEWSLSAIDFRAL
jgi:hypothetical protein